MPLPGRRERDLQYISGHPLRTRYFLQNPSPGQKQKLFYLIFEKHENLANFRHNLSFPAAIVPVDIKAAGPTRPCKQAFFMVQCSSYKQFFMIGIFLASRDCCT